MADPKLRETYEVMKTRYKNCYACHQEIPKGTRTLVIYSQYTGTTYHLCGRCEVDREEHPSHFPTS